MHRRLVSVGSETMKKHAHRPTTRRVLLYALFVAVALMCCVWVLQIFTLLRDGDWRSFGFRGADTKCADTSFHRDPGFSDKEICLTRTQLADTILGVLLVAKAAFEAHNVSYFLESGTLLGSYREKNIIPFDRDADLGVSAEGLAYLQHNRIELPEDYHLTVWNSSLDPSSYRDDKLPARVIHKPTGLYADIFAFLRWEDEKSGVEFVGPLPSLCYGDCKRCPKLNGLRHFKVPKAWIYPLIDCPLGRHTFKCPRESAKYLRFLYGNSYMTPDH